MQGKSFQLAVLAVIFGVNVGGQSRGAPGSVTFFSARDGNNEIYVMDPDGGQVRRITENAFSDMDPDISTNGQDIVFTSNRAGNNDIFIVDSAGGPPENLTEIPDKAFNDGWARWSPDGHQIVFHSNRTGNFRL